MVGNLFTTTGRKGVVILVAGRTHNRPPFYHHGPKRSCDFSRGPDPQPGPTTQAKVHMMFINIIFLSGEGALEYESDGVPKQGAFGVGFRRKKRVIVCGIQNFFLTG